MSGPFIATPIYPTLAQLITAIKAPICLATLFCTFSGQLPRLESFHPLVPLKLNLTRNSLSFKL